MDDQGKLGQSILDSIHPFGLIAAKGQPNLLNVNKARECLSWCYQTNPILREKNNLITVKAWNRCSLISTVQLQMNLHFEGRERHACHDSQVGFRSTNFNVCCRCSTLQRICHKSRTRKGSPKIYLRDKVDAIYSTGFLYGFDMFLHMNYNPMDMFEICG